MENISNSQIPYVLSKLVSRAKGLVSYFSELQCKKKKGQKGNQHNPREGLFFSFPLESSCQFNLSQNTVSDEHD